MLGVTRGAESHLREFLRVKHDTTLPRFDVLAAMNPQGRLIAPSEVTAMALFLCGPGSEGVNGQALTIAGGEL